MVIRKKTSRKHWYVAAVAALLIVIVVVLELTNTSHIFHTERGKSGTIPARTIEPSKQNAPSTSSKNTQSNAVNTYPKSSAGGGQTSSGQAGTPEGQGPLAPYGSFVSNHRPNIGGNPAPSKELSTCTTSVGATCYIEFKNDGVVTKLPAQTADVSGSTSWSGDINDAGFAEGTWKITAIATLNGKTSSTSDTIDLVVLP
jgi:hypothetical protein